MIKSPYVIYLIFFQLLFFMIPDVIFLLYFARFESSKKRSEIAKNPNLKVWTSSTVCAHVRTKLIYCFYILSLDIRRNQREIQRPERYWQRKNDDPFVGWKCGTSSLECENRESACHLPDVKVSYWFHEFTDIQLASSARDSRTAC